MGGEKTPSTKVGNNFDPPKPLRILPLASQHASTASRLHIAGQPGTFLSSLGPDVLEVVYAALPHTNAGFGFVAAPADKLDRPDTIVAFISATTSIGRLFVETGIKYAGRLLPPLSSQFGHHPALIGRSVQTALYPLLVRDHISTANDDVQDSTAELLSIMVAEEWRSHGIGAKLLDALIADCTERRITRLDVTVDSDNQRARRFYSRHGFTQQKSFQLYGRQMHQYSRPLKLQG